MTPHRVDGRVVEPKRAVPRQEIGRPEAGATALSRAEMASASGGGGGGGGGNRGGQGVGRGPRGSNQGGGNWGGRGSGGGGGDWNNGGNQGGYGGGNQGGWGGNGPWENQNQGGGWNQGGQGGYNSGGNWSNDNFGGGYQQGYGGGPVRNNFNSGGRPAPYGINSGPSGRQSGDSRWLPPFGGQVFANLVFVMLQGLWAAEIQVAVAVAVTVTKAATAAIHSEVETWAEVEEEEAVAAEGDTRSATPFSHMPSTDWIRSLVMKISSLKTRKKLEGRQVAEREREQKKEKGFSGYDRQD
ncbi:Heterogeneous nuclear ribonucleoprotein A1, A2/B1-like protein [Harpegnathos saltator]|uniref:Heterogeneous nuclear ribonucleoprotein A1, A2/B1-like protein n=1 Tax=Harpegnathos saltator TaxID=610380 RepID=E2BQH9_HARSA|nr:Heterogeneous nuclear ribonucleoprotein A1, A2/B1-like protein [Harpegnathos saltator]